MSLTAPERRELARREVTLPTPARHFEPRAVRRRKTLVHVFRPRLEREVSAIAARLSGAPLRYEWGAAVSAPLGADLVSARAAEAAGRARRNHRRLRPAGRHKGRPLLHLATPLAIFSHRGGGPASGGSCAAAGPYRISDGRCFPTPSPLRSGSGRRYVADAAEPGTRSSRPLSPRPQRRTRPTGTGPAKFRLPRGSRIRSGARHVGHETARARCLTRTLTGPISAATLHTMRHRRLGRRGTVPVHGEVRKRATEAVTTNRSDAPLLLCRAAACMVRKVPVKLTCSACARTARDRRCFDLTRSASRSSPAPVTTRLGKHGVYRPWRSDHPIDPASQPVPRRRCRAGSPRPRRPAASRRAASTAIRRRHRVGHPTLVRPFSVHYPPCRGPRRSQQPVTTTPGRSRRTFCCLSSSGPPSIAPASITICVPVM